MSIESSKQIFWLEPVTAKFIKLKVNKMVDAIDEDAAYNRTNMQMSKFELLDDSGARYAFTTDAVVTVSEWVDVYEHCENILKDDFSKMCVNYNSNLPFEVTISLGEAIDMNVWSRYRIWTANDQVKFPSRSITSWETYFSYDSISWQRMDNITDYQLAQLQNNAVYFTSEKLT